MDKLIDRLSIEAWGSQGAILQLDGKSFAYIATPVMADSNDYDMYRRYRVMGVGRGRNRPVRDLHENPTDNLPPDLLDRLSLDARVIGANGVPNNSTQHLVTAVLAALAEWADGALIDPATWTRVTARQYVNGAELCTTHDEFHIETYSPPRSHDYGRRLRT